MTIAAPPHGFWLLTSSAMRAIDHLNGRRLIRRRRAKNVPLNRNQFRHLATLAAYYFSAHTDLAILTLLT
jgi:hypothetical protein